MLSKLTSVVLLTPLFASIVAHALPAADCSADTGTHSSHQPPQTHSDVMDTSKLLPNDPRVRNTTATIRGKTYAYIVGFGWRYQVPYLMSLGFRVVVPDMLGYAGTDCPEDVRDWSFKNIAADIKELAGKFVGDGQIILGGHDWGGAAVWRVALWHPELIKAVFSLCTPFSPPRKDYLDLKDVIAAGNLTNFRYQLQLRGPDVENTLQGKDNVRLFLNGMHGGVGPNGELGFSAENGGVLFDNLTKLARPKGMTGDELDFYVQQYMRQKAPQLHGPLNWYRTSKISWEEELPLAGKKTSLEMPTLFISATNDTALPPSMSIGMEQYMPKLTRGEVQSSHWAPTEASADVNKQLGKWLDGVLNGAVKSAL
ncbi:alpha/beta hydrolase fold domain-containing protein [Hirsutella rhossiliensis]|uniref:Alpha/beta hydrolase fold domain-containing protein n=1 Tax=Hirsutella rhossiliensis TaxID=111463 RepID=A0A9P8MXU3_9HYPO|nr:alpha/beta hydrolase fold domain-containing protein [Hirsutella rhossiliensis]KAH0962962.1 alpha/beta hydrolase fold domain-containing protein [Hirsutella rhossiliensis]